MLIFELKSQVAETATLSAIFVPENGERSRKTPPRNPRNSRNGWFWVPTLYFAEGLHAALITTVSR